MRTCKEIFEQELSGEPLTQDSVVEGMIIAQSEILEHIGIIMYEECENIYDCVWLIQKELDKLKEELK